MIVVLILMFVFVGCHSLNRDQEDEYIIYSQGAKSSGRIWQQKEFVLSTFSAVPEDTTKYLSALTKIKEVNFNYIETAWLKSENTEKILLICDEF